VFITHCQACGPPGIDTSPRLWDNGNAIQRNNYNKTAGALPKKSLVPTLRVGMRNGALRAR